jgi:alginate O-acetyltransferase complex protein AlgI
MYNFNCPYVSRTPSEFWQRWHISLSSWLRDYLYIPLGGNRGSSFLTYRNLILTMFLGGIWHGANWTFLAWGAFHGIILCTYRIFGIVSKPISTSSWIIPVLQWAIMSCLTLYGWLLFRADSITQANQMMYAIAFQWSWTPYASFMLGKLVLFALPLFLFELGLATRNDLLLPLRWHWIPQLTLYFAILIALLIFVPENVSEFIYFQF